MDFSRPQIDFNDVAGLKRSFSGANQKELKITSADRVVCCEDIRQLVLTQSPSINAGSRCGERSEEHTSELHSLMRNSYAVFCLKTKKQTTYKTIHSIRKRTMPVYTN